MRVTRMLAVVVCAGMVCGTVELARAQAPAPAAGKPLAARDRDAKKHYLRGAAHFKAKRWAEAILEYRKAYNLAPRPALLFNIARALHEEGDKAEALRHYQRYLDEEPDGPASAEARDYVTALTAELNPPPPQEPVAGAPVAGQPPPAAPPATPVATEPAPDPAPAAPAAAPPAAPPASADPGPAPADTTIAAHLPRPPRRLLLGGMAGLALADLRDNNWHGGPRYGVAVGVFARWRAMPWLIVRPELAYVQKGSGEDKVQGYSGWHTDFVQLDGLVQVPLGYAAAGLGGYVGRRIASDTVFGDENLATADYGYLFAISVAVPLGVGHVTADARLERGVATQLKSDNALNRTFMLAVGYAY